MLPYMKSAMFLYLSRKTGEAFDPAGFRLPGDEIPESETGNPFPDLGIDGVEEPMYQKQTTADFYRLNKTGSTDPQIFYLKLPEAQVMKYCRDNDGSPNVFCSVMLAKAARHSDPESDKTISVLFVLLIALDSLFQSRDFVGKLGLFLFVLSVQSGVSAVGQLS